MTHYQVNRHELFIIGVENILVNHSHAARVRNISALANDVDTAQKKLPALIEETGLYTGRTTLEKFYPLARAELGLQVGFSDFKAAWNSHYSHNLEAETVIRALAGRHRVVGLANTDADASAYLKREFDVVRVPHTTYESHVLGLKKPSIELLLEVLKLERMDPAGAVMIDRDVNTVNGMMALGGRGIHYTTPQNLIRALAVGGVTIDSPRGGLSPAHTLRYSQPRPGKVVSMAGSMECD